MFRSSDNPAGQPRPQFPLHAVFKNQIDFQTGKVNVLGTGFTECFRCRQSSADLQFGDKPLQTGRGAGMVEVGMGEKVAAQMVAVGENLF